MKDGLTIKKCIKTSLDSAKLSSRLCFVQFEEIRGIFKLDIPEFQAGTVLGIKDREVRVLARKKSKLVDELNQLLMFYNVTKEFLSYQDIYKIWNCTKTNCYQYYLLNPYFMMNRKIVCQEVQDTYSFTYQDLLKNIQPTTFSIRRDEICFCIEEIIKKEESLGNTYCEFGVLERKVREALAIAKHPLTNDETDISPFLNYKVKDNSLYCDMSHLSSSSPVFRRETYNIEKGIYDNVKLLMLADNKFRSLDMVDNPNLSDEQNKAVSDTITSDSNITIITGGPGTGKTTIINEIIRRVCEALPKTKVHIVAPTGRASKRAEETIQYRSENIDISTVHKFVGFGSAYSQTDNLVPKYDLIILDEASMASPAIFYKLLDQMDKAKTKIILVGDVDQLPSIDPGDILNDLIYLGVPTSYLTENYRSNSSIVKNSRLVNKGKYEELEYSREFELIDTSSLINKEEINKMAVEDSARDIMETEQTGNGIIISPYISDSIPYSSSILNKEMHIVYNMIHPQSVKLGKYYYGEPVIFTHTNYKSGTVYFNGEVGRVVNYHTTGDFCEYEIAMGENRIAIAPAEHIESAYAITVHKSQGSEYRSVYIVIPEQTSFITRKLFYTAITRAKNKLRIYSTPEIIKSIIQNVSDKERNTLLKLMDKFG